MARFGALAFHLAHGPSPPCENGGLCAIHQVQPAQDATDIPFHRTRLTRTPCVQSSTKLPARMVSDDDVVEPLCSITPPWTSYALGVQRVHGRACSLLWGTGCAQYPDGEDRPQHPPAERQRGTHHDHPAQVRHMF